MLGAGSFAPRGSTTHREARVSVSAFCRVTATAFSAAHLLLPAAALSVSTSALAGALSKRKVLCRNSFSVYRLHLDCHSCQHLKQSTGQYHPQAAMNHLLFRCQSCIPGKETRSFHLQSHLLLQYPQNSRHLQLFNPWLKLSKRMPVSVSVKKGNIYTLGGEPKSPYTRAL